MGEIREKLELVDLELRYPISGKRRADSESSFLAVDLVGSDRVPPILIHSTEFTIILGPSGCGTS